MPKKSHNRTFARESANRIDEPTIDPATMEPNRLREWLMKALSALSPDERASMRDSLLTGLRRAGVDLGPSLLILGIPARVPDELTAPELSMLMRYVRINWPGALKSISTQLAELLARSPRRSEIARRAA